MSSVGLFFLKSINCVSNLMAPRRGHISDTFFCKRDIQISHIAKLVICFQTEYVLLYHCHYEAIQVKTCAVPPIRSGFPDFGPDPDFFDQNWSGFSPHFCQKSGF